MAAIPAPEQQADSARAVLAAVREARAAADREEVRILELALDWAAIHGPGDAESLGFERGVLVAGEGTPEVGEFCAHEFAAALNLSTESGRSLIAAQSSASSRIRISSRSAAARASRTAASTARAESACCSGAGVAAMLHSIRRHRQFSVARQADRGRPR